MWLEVPKIIVKRSNHTLAAVLKLIDLQLPKVNANWAIAETEKLSNEITVSSLIVFFHFFIVITLNLLRLIICNLIVYDENNEIKCVFSL